LDKPLGAIVPDIEGKRRREKTLRNTALKAIDDTRFVPAAGQNRLRGMIENRPDWVLSRQRAWGVPIAVFVHHETGELLQDEAVNARIGEAFRAEGADAWFADGAGERFLGNDHNPEDWEKVDDILDVWFDSGSTHAFCLEQRPDLKWPADLYLEGSDQHRGWFHSSLLESCGTRGRAPYDAVLTHGFVMAEDGRKMSKSLGNQVVPQDIIKQSGADILRLWVVSSDYMEDLRIGPEILKTNIDAYRKLRNTTRWMLGSLAHYRAEDAVQPAGMPELERLMLSELARLDGVIHKAYGEFDYKRIFSALFNFMTVDLSAFYFDVRKDALYCDPASSLTRKAALTVIDLLFDTLVKWLAPMLPFTCEEAWMLRHGEASCVHLELFPDVPDAWRDTALEAKWKQIRQVRSVVTGALEIERREKRIGSSLEAAPQVFIADEALHQLMQGVDLAEIAITSQAELAGGEGPADAFRLAEVPGVAVIPGKAVGTKCARSWKILPDVGSDPDYPDISPRDAAAMREFEAARQAAE
jgi:isoleucyl-tRNA synthetase